MFKYVILSDIHANLEALLAVLQDIEGRDLAGDFLISLGDVIGYGPNPLECWDIIGQRNFVTILGNHEQTVFDPRHLEDCNEHAKRSLEWTRRTIMEDPQGNSILDCFSRLEYALGELSIAFVHGSMRSFTDEYLFPSDLETDMPKVLGNFNMMDNYEICFHGHTHIPGAFVRDISGEILYFSPTGNESLALDLKQKKYIINPGSVGQPRDIDWRASYCVYDPEAKIVNWYRVEYEYQTTYDKIIAIPDIPDEIAGRLVP